MECKLQDNLWNFARTLKIFVLFDIYYYYYYHYRSGWKTKSFLIEFFLEGVVIIYHF